MFTLEDLDWGALIVLGDIAERTPGLEDDARDFRLIRSAAIESGETDLSAMFDCGGEVRRAARRIVATINGDDELEDECDGCPGCAWCITAEDLQQRFRARMLQDRGEA